jgi:hypothetical protein
MDKILARIKDPSKREEKANDFHKMLHDIRLCSRLAAESIVRLGSLFNDDWIPISKDNMDWIIDAV